MIAIRSIISRQDRLNSIRTDTRVVLLQVFLVWTIHVIEIQSFCPCNNGTLSCLFDIVDIFMMLIHGLIFLYRFYISRCVKFINRRSFRIWNLPDFFFCLSDDCWRSWKVKRFLFSYNCLTSSWFFWGWTKYGYFELNKLLGNDYWDAAKSLSLSCFD